MHISDGNYEKKLKSWLMKIRNAELVFEISYSYLRLAARLPELASKLHWKDITFPSGFTSSIRVSFQLITRRVNVVIVEFHIAEMNLAPKGYYIYIPCQYCLK